MPDEKGANALRAEVLDNFDMSLGTGLNKVEDRVFRIGHLGDFNDLMLMGTLCGVEMGLMRVKANFQRGGAQAAMEYLAEA
jgi:alanine-glyoxylate transaminase/serine-glyoxylate transaminase/serine-pyruvate transaminase